MHKNDNNTGLQASPQALTRSDELFLNRLIKNKTLHLTVDPDHIVRKWQGDRFLGYGLRSCEVEIMQPTTLRELNAMQAIAVDNNKEFDFTWHHQLMQNGQSFSPMKTCPCGCFNCSPPTDLPNGIPEPSTTFFPCHLPKPISEPSCKPWY